MLLLLVILAFAFRSQILTGIADYLIVSDKLQPADVIVLLNSEFNTRPFRASELYQAGAGSRDPDCPVGKHANRRFGIGAQ